MAISYNPSVVRDNLSLYIDANNRGSYPGLGSTVFDISGNNRNFTGNPSFVSNATGIRSGSSWVCSSTLVNNLLNTDFFSMFFYIIFNTTPSNSTSTSGNWDMIVQHGPSGTDRSPGIWRWPSERRIHWRYAPSNSGHDFGKDAAGNQFDVNTWYSIGQTKNGATVTSYVNGIQVGSDGGVNNPKTAGNADIVLFPYYPETLCNINMLTIYNKVLSAQEVQENFSATRARYGI
jgi:hypothetical protein